MKEISQRGYHNLCRYNNKKVHLRVCVCVFSRLLLDVVVARPSLGYGMLLCLKPAS